MSTLPNLGAEHLPSSASDPEVVVNANDDLLDHALNSYIAINFTSDADYTLSTATDPQEWQYGFIDLTDTGVVLTGAVNVIVPDNAKKTTFKNATAQNITIKTSAGTGITLNAGVVQNLQCDGTNVIDADGGGTTELSTDTSPQLGGDLDTNGNMINESKGSDIASGSTLTIPTDGNFFDVTGTTTITSFSAVAVGTEITLQFDAVLTLTHHATDLVLPTGADITTAAGDVAKFREYAAGDWLCTSYQKVNGQPLAAGSASILDMPTLSKSAAYTVTTGDQGKLIECDATSSGFTITLPAAATAGDGFTVGVKKIDSSSNTVTIDGSGSETIDGSATKSTSTPWDQFLLQCNGTSWNVFVKPSSSTTDADAIHDNVAGEITAVTEKTTIDPDDEFLIEDSEASNAKKKVTFSTLSKLEENAQTSTTYTLVLDDAYKHITMTNASESTLTVPPNSSVAFEVGTVITVTQQGAGQVTLTEGSGVTINAPDSTLTVRAQYSTVALVKMATDEWLAMGDLG